MAGVINFLDGDLVNNPQPSAPDWLPSHARPVATLEGVAMFEVMIIAPAGIASQEAFGTPNLSGNYTITPPGIASAEAIGTPTIFANQFITVEGIASAEEFGTANIFCDLTITCTAIDGEESFGVPTVSIYVPPPPPPPVPIEYCSSFAIGPCTGVSGSSSGLPSKGSSNRKAAISARGQSSRVGRPRAIGTSNGPRNC